MSDRMDALSSSLGTTSVLGTSDEGAVDSSFGATTPEGSPHFYASLTDRSVEKHLPSPSEFSTSQDASRSRSKRRSLPDILDPATAAGIVVRNICFVGAGYVGSPTAAVIALKNPSLRVTVIDRDALRIRRWNSAHLPISEPGLSDVVRVARDGLKASQQLRGSSDKGIASQARQSNLIFTTASAKSIADADMIFIAVNTPTKTVGLGAGFATDMTALSSVVEEIAAHSKDGAILVEKSTVPCRTAQLIEENLETLRPGSKFQVLSNPEFLSEGTAIKDLMQPDRVLIGSPNTVQGRRAAAALVNVYASWIPRSKVLGTNVWSSELSKLVANSMLAQRISSINSIGAICEKTGADVREIAKSVGLDARIGPKFLQAGLGFGGSCFKKDIASLCYLANSLGLPEVGDYWNQVLLINDRQRTQFARKVIARLNNTLVGKKITLLGFAFKKDTGDTRESVAIDIIRILLEERPAEIAIFDPCCSPSNIQRELDILCSSNAELQRQQKAIKICTDPYQACHNSNAILIVTDWDGFRTAPTTFVPNGSKQPSHLDLAKFSKLPPSVEEKDDQTSTGIDSQYYPEPSCPSECPECRDSFSGFQLDQDFEWARVSYHMKKPRWVFDGRGVLDVAEMERHGFRVEVLGRAGSAPSFF